MALYGREMVDSVKFTYSSFIALWATNIIPQQIPIFAKYEDFKYSRNQYCPLVSNAKIILFTIVVYKIN